MVKILSLEDVFTLLDNVKATFKAFRRSTNHLHNHLIAGGDSELHIDLEPDGKIRCIFTKCDPILKVFAVSLIFLYSIVDHWKLLTTEII